MHIPPRVIVTELTPLIIFKDRTAALFISIFIIFVFKCYILIQVSLNFIIYETKFRILGFLFFFMLKKYFLDNLKFLYNFCCY